MNYRTSLPILLLAIAETGCLPSNPSTELYICTNHSLSPHFTEILGEILERHGFRTAVGQAVDAQGGRNYVLEAKKNFLRVWAQNVPISPPLVQDTEPKLGVSVDPDQYIVSVQSWLSSIQSPKPTFTSIRRELILAGLQIHDRSGMCTSGPGPEKTSKSNKVGIG